MSDQDYALLDSGRGQKLERFGPITLARPCAQAVWEPQGKGSWKADATFSREEQMRWEGQRRVPDRWVITLEGLRFLLSPTDFGHLGVFPEHAEAWRWLRRLLRGSNRQLRVLNLFAYSGAATLTAAQEGAEVCHVDASQGMVAWARDNAAENGLAKSPIRWIVDDVRKFLAREQRRGRTYDVILLDPPSFGRGKKGEIFKIEHDLPPLLDLCRSVLSNDAVGLFLSCHTPGYTPVVLQNILAQFLTKRGGTIEGGEMLLKGDDGVLAIPCGAYARWCNESKF